MDSLTRGVGVRAELRSRISLLYMGQTGFGAHTASYPVGAGSYFSASKQGGLQADHSFPTGTEVKKRGSIQPLPFPYKPSRRRAQLSTWTTLCLSYSAATDGNIVTSADKCGSCYLTVHEYCSWQTNDVGYLSACRKTAVKVYGLPFCPVTNHK
jgi:hypothetical protein